MINIISKSVYRRIPSGQKKVVDNLIKGLDQIGYPYVLNKSLGACARLWIHDDRVALQCLKSLSSDIKVVAGPILGVLPQQLPAGVDWTRVLYIQPSEWARAFWQFCGFDFCPVAVWPVGIDTDEFQPRQFKKDIVLVYAKQRHPEELAQVEQTLQSKKLAYVVLKYPGYIEADYKTLLQRARYCIWLGRQESQGIALEEGLSSGVPMLICDVNRFGQWYASFREMSLFSSVQNDFTGVTSAEYFDTSCGLKIQELDRLSEAVDQMEATYLEFRPREYIITHLALDKQARAFVNLYAVHFGLTFASGQTESVQGTKEWQNALFRYRVVGWGKDVAKSGLQMFSRLRKSM